MREGATHARFGRRHVDTGTRPPPGGLNTPHSSLFNTPSILPPILIFAYLRFFTRISKCRAGRRIPTSPMTRPRAQMERHRYFPSCISAMAWTAFSGTDFRKGYVRSPKDCLIPWKMSLPTRPLSMTPVQAAVPIPRGLAGRVPPAPQRMPGTPLAPR